MTSTDTKTLPKNQSVADEIDLCQIASAIRRQRFLIASVAGASMILSGIYAVTREPVWEGQFQIVLERKKSGGNSPLSQIGTSNSLIQDLVELGGGGGVELKTEVTVLESPSVLKPTYDFVKANKVKSGEDVSNWTFSGWLDGNLKIELKKGTSVLNIIYRDTNPDLVLPVLTKISNDYQQYSVSDRSKSIRNGLSFAKKQVDQFRQQANISSRELDTFSIRYGISSSGGKISPTAIDISVLQNLSKFTPTNSSAVNTQGDAFSKLASINQELIRRQKHYTSNDPGVLALIRERDALRRYIELTAGGSLALPGKQPATKEQAQQLILKFKELSRTASRDIATLSTLESSLLSLQLEQARQTDPWELISTPTLLDKPVGPHKKQIVAMGLFAGIIIGSGIGLLIDRRTGLVFSSDELKELLPCPLLKLLPGLSPAAWDDTADLLANGPLAAAGNKPIALVPVGRVPIDQLKSFASKLTAALGGRELILSNDLRQTSSCATQLLVTANGVATRNELSQLNQKLALQGTPLAGWVLLDPDLKLS